MLRREKGSSRPAESTIRFIIIRMLPPRCYFRHRGRVVLLGIYTGDMDEAKCNGMAEDWALDRAAGVIRKSRFCIALVGAGLSRESGVPTYRGAGGLWTRDGEPPLDQYQRFLADPAGWWHQRLAEEEHPGELAAAIGAARPNPGHRALVRLEQLGILKSIVTQNIDNLHQMAGSENVLEIHGNRTYLRCTGCQRRWRRETLPVESIPPLCPTCEAVVKSDTVMFGEPIPPSILDACFTVARRSDCMLVVGTSAVVHPAAELPLIARRRGADLIEINPELTPLTQHCAVALRGSAASVLPALVSGVENLL